MTCDCGQSAKRDGKCHPCYMRAWRAARKATGLPPIPCDETWFDWEVVRKAWYGSDTRRRTLAERVYLAGLLVNSGLGLQIQREILGMQWEHALQLLSDVREGRVEVPGRDWQGQPV